MVTCVWGLDFLEADIFGTPNMDSEKLFKQQTCRYLGVGSTILSIVTTPIALHELEWVVNIPTRFGKRQGSWGFDLELVVSASANNC